MGDDVEDNIGVAFDREIESPTPIHSGLPDVLAFVVLLGVQGRVVEVLNQKTSLLQEGFLY